MPTLRVGTTASNLQDVLEPSGIEWGLVDIVSNDSGRVQDATNRLYKMRTAQKVKLSLSWQLPDATEAAEILQAFQSEYVFVEYFDPLLGAITVKEFAPGDMSAPFKYYNIDGQTKFTVVSFELVER